MAILDPWICVYSCAASDFSPYSSEATLCGPFWRDNRGKTWRQFTQTRSALMMNYEPGLERLVTKRANLLLWEMNIVSMLTQLILGRGYFVIQTHKIVSTTVSICSWMIDDWLNYLGRWREITKVTSLPSFPLLLLLLLVRCALSWNLLSTSFLIIPKTWQCSLHPSPCMTADHM